MSGLPNRTAACILYPIMIHPMTVHFPIAFYVLGVLLTGLYLWRRYPEVERFAYGVLVLSWASALIACLTGLVAQGPLAPDHPHREAINMHISASVALFVINGGVVYMRFRWRDVLVSRPMAYLAVMVLGLIAVLAAGWTGGTLVYTHGIGVNPDAF